MEVSEAMCEQNTAYEASAASGEWIRPFKPNKPREVAVCRVKRGAMFQRNCGDNSIHDKWATGLALAHQAAQDFPMALARIEDAVAGWASQEEISVSASDVESGCSNTRGFVPMRRKVHSVSQAKQTISGPERTASSHARLAT